MIRRRSATRMERPARKSIQFDTDRAPEKSLAEISAGAIVAEPAAPMPELRRFAADADVVKYSHEAQLKRRRSIEHSVTIGWSKFGTRIEDGRLTFGNNARIDDKVIQVPEVDYRQRSIPKKCGLPSAVSRPFAGSSSFAIASSDDVGKIDMESPHSTSSLVLPPKENSAPLFSDRNAR